MCQDQLCVAAYAEDCIDGSTCEEYECSALAMAPLGAVTLPSPLQEPAPASPIMVCCQIIAVIQNFSS